jgi:hypothetical protein
MTIDDKPAFDAIFAADPPEISAYTFTNIFAWRGAYNTTISRLDDHILVLCDRDGAVSCLRPLGNGPILPVIDEILRRAGRLVTFERLTAGEAADLQIAGLAIESDRDNWDYVYSSEDIITLAGRKYDGKRNLIVHARSLLDYEYVRMDASMAAECEDFADYWCDQRKCETVDGLRKERCAIYEMLMHFDALGIVGGAIRANGAIVALSLGEAINPETLVVHIEKADPHIGGLYQLINNEFCNAEAVHYAYVNREQDLGIPGLRKAKESYHPVRMAETYRAHRP